VRVTTISIVGTGNMGSVLADLARTGSNTVEVLGSADTDKPVTGDVVVLAVQYAAIAEVHAQRADQLDGKVVVDITNPLDYASFDTLVVPPDSSAAAEIAAALPRARVLKAFNTTYAGHLATGMVGDKPTTVLIAGDDADAKAQLAEVVTAGGLRAIDAGDLKRARELEAMGFLQMTLCAAEKLPWTGGFAVLP
jgi:predicted dinucleotide-binding enzyme